MKNYIQLIIAIISLSLLVQCNSLPKEKKEFLKQTNDLISRVEKSKPELDKQLAKVEKLEIRLDELRQSLPTESQIKAYINKTGLSVEDTKTKIDYISKQINFTGPDLTSFKEKIKNPNTTNQFIKEYLMHASNAVEAIEMGINKIETAVIQIEDDLKRITDHIKKQS